MSRRGRVLCALVLIVTVMGLAQCGGAPTEAPPEAVATDTPAAPAAEGFGTIRVGTEAAYPPFENKDESGNIVGFDIDLMNAIAERAGFEVEYVDTPFDGIFVALQSGEFDAVISAATITSERAQIVDFSDPYFDAGLALVVRADSPYQAAEDLEGQPIGVQLGTTGDMEATDRYGEENVRRYDDVLLAFQALISGDVEGVVNDLPVTEGYMANNPESNLRLIPGMLTSEQYGIAVNKSRPELLAAINQALAEIKADGTYDEIYSKWITAPAAEEPAGVADVCGGVGNLKDVVAVDEYTVRIELCNPDPALPYKVAFGAMAFHSPANLEKYGGGGELGVNPVGTGPYVLQEWVRDDHITLVANPNYWGEPPKTPTLVMRPVVEAAARFLELQAGTVDIINNLGTDDFPVAEADPNIQVLERPPFNIGYLWMNRDVEKFSDQRVRQAVAMCLDRQALLDAFYPPASLVAEQFMPPGLLGHTEGLTWYPRDVEMARGLLAEAGYPDGLDATLSLREVARGYLPEPSKVAEAIQAQLAECGVRVTIDVVESGAFLDGAAAGDFEMGLLGWLADYPDPTNWLDFHFMGTGAGDQFGQPFPDIVELLTQAARLPDPAERQPLYDQVNELLKEYAVMVPIAHGGSAMAASADVEGLLASPLNTEVYAPVSKPGADTLIYAKNGDAISLDCTDETDGESFEVCSQIFDGLLEFIPGTTEVRPALATSYDVNEDATQWVFTLRQGVTFSDGTPFNADAVVINFQRQWDPENPLHVGRTGEFYYFATFFGGFKGD
ncbi:MAG: transporter substrate-binding domain-containing protein [Anaerolineae bacterium]|nr:transporter substrate-binding domain-containing protein [Anaerolineae bacterium]